jgi:hypothetical protein
MARRKHWRVEDMIHRAPTGVRKMYYQFRRDSRGWYHLIGLGCYDWSYQDSPVWVYIQTGQALRAHLAAWDAEDWAARVEGLADAAEAAYRLARYAAGAEAAADQAAEAVRAAEDARAEARRAAEDAHQAACEAAAAACDDDRAAAAARAARAAVGRAMAARRAAGTAYAVAEAAARDAGASDGDICALYSRASDSASRRATRVMLCRRHQREPRWRPTWYVSSRFHGDPRRALEALAAEYLGARA